MALQTTPGQTAIAFVTQDGEVRCVNLRSASLKIAPTEAMLLEIAQTVNALVKRSTPA
jgi:hypothetical protein